MYNDIKVPPVLPLSESGVVCRGKPSPLAGAEVPETISVAGSMSATDHVNGIWTEVLALEVSHPKTQKARHGS